MQQFEGPGQSNFSACISYPDMVKEDPTLLGSFVEGAAHK